MKDENTILNNPSEETQLDHTQPQNEQGAQAAPHNRPTWVKMAGSAGTGLLLGAASTLLASSTPSDPEEMAEVTGQSASSPSAAPAAAAANVESVPVATSVSDDMSFGEAFAAARHEVGPGGAFEWHGNVYGTYYAEEWNAMSEAQQDEFYSHVTLVPHSAPAQQPAEVAEVVDVTPTTPTDPTPADDEMNVEVLGVVHDAETDANVVSLSMNGHNAILVDIDNDHQIDLMAVDVNNDGQVDNNEIADISGQGLTIEQFGAPGDPSGNLYASNEPLPDYVNNANMDNYNA